MKSTVIEQERDRSWLTWLWLLVGFILFPFTIVQAVIPLAAWFAPVFFLRFARTSGRKWIALALIFFAYIIGAGIAARSFTLSIFPVIVTVFRGLVYSLPYLGDQRIASRLKGWGRLFVFPLAFTTIDWAVSPLKPITTSWSPAYSQVGNLALMQIISITGMWGLTFLITWFASTLNALWEQKFDWRPVRAQVAVFAVAFVAVILFGSLRLNFAAPSSQTVEAATVTIDSSVLAEAIGAVDWTTFNRSADAVRAAARPKFQATVKQMLQRTETALRGGAKIVGWEESAPFVLEEDTQDLLDRAAALARQYDAYLQISPFVFTRAPKWPYVRNQSILIDNAGHTVWTYEKTYPVPGAEAFVVIAGPGRLPVADTPYGRLSTAICYDLNFPALIRQAGRHGVDILIAPYDEIRPFDQRMAAISRVIENGVSIIRPTGNGVSLITDYEGRVLGSQNYFTDNSGIMLTTIPTRGVRTVYSRIGDGFAYLSVVALVLLAIWAFRRKEPAVERQPS